MKTTMIAFKESARLTPTNLSKEMVEFLLVLLEVAPETEDGIMWVTEGYRKEIHPNDAHTWCSAWDIRSKNVLAASWQDRREVLIRWVELARETLRHKPWYQFEVHGDGDALHMHAEIDPRQGG